MLATKRLTLETLDASDKEQLDAFIDQVMETGMKRVSADLAKLREAGLMDSEGRLLNTELPPDMREGSGLDFGG